MPSVILSDSPGSGSAKAFPLISHIQSLSYSGNGCIIAWHWHYVWHGKNIYD